MDSLYNLQNQSNVLSAHTIITASHNNTLTKTHLVNIKLILDYCFLTLEIDVFSRPSTLFNACIALYLIKQRTIQFEVQGSIEL